jgi:hypothetical protein
MLIFRLLPGRARTQAQSVDLAVLSHPPESKHDLLVEFTEACCSTLTSPRIYETDPDNLWCPPGLAGLD